MCYSGEFGDTYTYNDLHDLEGEVRTTLTNQLNEYDVLEFLDGTLIRYYYHNNKWNIATKGHSDASKAKWNSNKSFLQLFEEVLQDYPTFTTDELDKNNTYLYVLQHVDNKIVCPVKENRIYFIKLYSSTI